MVMLGAASAELAVREEDLLKYVRLLFGPRGEAVVEMNLRAFSLGRDAAAASGEGVETAARIPAK